MDERFRSLFDFERSAPKMNNHFTKSLIKKRPQILWPLFLESYLISIVLTIGLMLKKPINNVLPVQGSDTTMLV